MGDPETLRHVLAKLEPDSGFEGCAHDKSFTPELQATLSIAISLKRIADVVCGDDLMWILDDRAREARVG